MVWTEKDTYRVEIFISGPIEIGKQLVRRYVLKEPLCVTIHPTDFIYTGGEESGYVVGIRNYPRFPHSNEWLFKLAEEIARKLMLGTFQLSVMLVADDKTVWIDGRDTNYYEMRG